MEQITGGPWVEITEACPECNGTGRSRARPNAYAEGCATCNATGKRKRTITILELRELLGKAGDG
jgi:DnaJ-class molecular chaperone